MLSTMAYVPRKRSSRDDQTTNKNERDAGQCASSASGHSMTNLEHYLHDESDALRIEIVGNLSGPGVAGIKHAWQTATSVLAGRHIVVGLTTVAEADDDGRGLLLSWHRRGARIVARSMDSRTLAESILGASVPMAPAKSGWRQRFSDFLRRWAAAAAKRADADKRVDFLGAREP
jgi:hypothetical protein